MDYIYIRAWHLMTGSYQYYIDMMVSKARRDNAPENAIYFDDFSHHWKTVDDIVSPETRAEVTAFANRLRSDKAAPEAGKDTIMILFINNTPMGNCTSYEQLRELPHPGWLFHMETGLNIFIRFDEIRSFTSSGELRIIEKNA